MRRLTFIPAVLALMLAMPIASAAYTSPTWNLNGTYTIDFTCTSGCGGDYIHQMTITTTSDTTGDVTGTGHYSPGSPTWVVTGQVTGWDVVLDVDYDGSTYAVHLVGTINLSGGMSGTATGPGQTFTWATTSGSVGLFSPRCEYGTYPDADLVWSAFAPATGSVVTTPALDPYRDYFVEASGTYFAGGNGQFDIEADAEYSQDAAQRAVAAPWTDSVNTYEGLGEGLLELYIDGAAVEWGAFNADHRYTLDVVPSGSPLDISANIYDSYAPNNTGGLCVAVYARDYDFTGFFAPVDNLPAINLARAGSAIPVKFSLDGYQGLDIFAAGSPTSHVVSCETGENLDAIEATVTAGGSSLSYDPITDQYVYVWKTLKAWSGTCRQLDVELADGNIYSAVFQFK